MFLLQQSCRASRLLRGTAHQFDIKLPLKACTAVTSAESSQGRHADWARHDLPGERGGPLQDAPAMSRAFRCHIDHHFDLHSHNNSLHSLHSTQSAGWTPHGAALAATAGIGAEHATSQHRQFSSAQPPPFPQPPSMKPTAPLEEDPDLRDEADHERLSRRLEDAHGPATDKPPLDAFRPLNSDGPHSSESVSQAAIILKVRAVPQPPCCLLRLHMVSASQAK